MDSQAFLYQLRQVEVHAPSSVIHFDKLRLNPQTARSLRVGQLGVAAHPFFRPRGPRSQEDVSRPFESGR
jgi:hypothetical protein